MYLTAGQKGLPVVGEENGMDLVLDGQRPHHQSFENKRYLSNDFNSNIIVFALAQ